LELEDASERFPEVHLFSISKAAFGWSIGTMWPESWTWPCQKNTSWLVSQWNTKWCCACATCIYDLWSCCTAC
jgi:hypothetical protein